MQYYNIVIVLYIIGILDIKRLVEEIVYIHIYNIYIAYKGNRKLYRYKFIIQLIIIFQF